MRTLVLIGKIGPAFNGTHILSHGSSSTTGYYPFALEMCMNAMEQNLIQANDYIEFQTDYLPRNDFEGAIIHWQGTLDIDNDNDWLDTSPISYDVFNSRTGQTLAWRVSLEMAKFLCAEFPSFDFDQAE